MNMEIISIGQKVPEWATGKDGCVMEYHNVGGLVLIYSLNTPNCREIKAFDAFHSFKISFTSIRDVGFFCIKVGELGWSDCAFSPNIYYTVPELPKLEPGVGYPLTVIFVDSATGEVKAIRLIGLGHAFSCQFREWCISSLQKHITMGYYQKVVGAVFSQFSTLELVELSSAKWAI